MRKYARLFFLLLITGTLQQAAAQCGITNLYFELKQFSQTGAGCTATFDLGWDQIANNGNKYSYVHLWTANNYPTNYTFPTSGTGPKAGTNQILTTSNSFGTITVLNGAVSTSPYPNGPSAPLLTGTLTMTPLANNAGYRYRIVNVVKTFATCPASSAAELAIKGVVWSAQDAQGKNVACISTNVNFLPAQTESFNLAGQFFCVKQNQSRGRQYKLDFTSTSASNQPQAVAYDVYVDNGDKAFSQAAETRVATVNGLSLHSGHSYSSGALSYEPYSSRAPEANQGLWVFATVTTAGGDAFTRLLYLDNSCNILPVRYSYFNAARNARNKQQVDLAWETTVEQNNKGFYLQRKTDGDWQEIGLIFSASETGTTNAPTAYKFKDRNLYTGATQYRLLQVDTDGRGNYSEAKTVVGDASNISLLVYPNPVQNGRATVLFPDSGPRQVLLTDMNGRIVQQYQQHTASSLVLQGLKKGFYTLKVQDAKTGLLNYEKIIVQ